MGWTRCPEKAGYHPSPWSYYALAVLHLDDCTWAIPTSELTLAWMCFFMLINITEWLGTDCSDAAASHAHISCPDGLALSESTARERLCPWSSCSGGTSRPRTIALPYRHAFSGGVMVFVSWNANSQPALCHECGEDLPLGSSGPTRDYCTLRENPTWLQGSS